MKMFDPQKITEAISILKPDGQLFEVRIIRGLTSLSGYFMDPAHLIHALQTQDLRQANVYMTLHELHEGCVARLQWNCFMNASKEKLPTTSDRDVIRYKYIPIDLDPVRPAGISSSYQELLYAADLRSQIIEYMEAQGFTDYISAFSGNGYHLLYKTDMPNDEASVETMKRYLQRLDELFSNEFCHVDTTNYNPGRIFKLYGTLAQKGRSTEDRPHRMSRIAP